MATKTPDTTSTSNPGALQHWLNSRLSLDVLQSLGEKKKVPLHRQSIWYYLGGIALVLLAVQLVTGLLLMVYYIPEISAANASILKINSKVEFGWFIRSLHSWGANFMILAVMVHLYSAYRMKAYRPPREMTWLTGLVLLVLCLGFGFTGYLLPWDEVSFFATKIGLDITHSLPVVGPWLAEMLRGGDAIGQATLSRFFAIHVMLLPLLMAGLLGLHLWLVQAHGMSEPAHFKEKPESEKRYEPFFPNFLLKDFMVWLMVVNILSLVVMLFPWSVGPEADPFAAAPVGIKPEWYFLAMFQFLKLMPAHVGPIEGELAGLGVFFLTGLLMALAPFLDTGKCSTTSKLFSGYGRVVVLAFVALTLWGWLA